jgi:mono/diheme cytochrome c family protein
MTRLVLLGIACGILSGASQAFGADAGANWGTYCAACHGSDGAGKTKAGRMVKVTDLTDAGYQKSFTDDQAVTAITDGMTDKDGNVRMRPLKDKITPDEAKALIAYVRTLAK